MPESANNRNNFGGIIFDLDGTLAETHELIFASFNHIAEKYLNKRMTNVEIASHFGPTEDVILKNWAKGNYDQARKDYYDYYESRHDEMVTIFPGLKEIIQLIKNKNIPLGIFTGKGYDSTIITLKAIGLHNLFDMIVTGDDVEEHKPSPEGINKFVEKFGLDRNKVLMVGDAHVDVIAAKQAGVKVAAVLWDSLTADKIKNLNPDYIFHAIEEFSNFIKASIS